MLGRRQTGREEEILTKGKTDKDVDIERLRGRRKSNIKGIR